MPIHETWIIKAVSLGLFAAAFLFISLWGFIKRKPLLVPTKWNFILMMLIFLPNFIPLASSKNSAILGSTTWMLVLIMIFLFIFFWIIFKGYSAYGVTDKSFRKTIISSLEKLKLDYTEDMTGIHLKSEDVSLRGAIFMGTGQIRVKGKDSGKILDKIAPVLKKEFEKPNIEFDIKPFIFYFVMAVIFVALAFLELSLIQKIGNL